MEIHETLPLFCAELDEAVASRHWLLDAVYGRELLKARLRQLRPDMRVPVWCERPELDPVLDAVIDDLNLREWQKPSGLKLRIAYLRIVLKMINAVRCGELLPAW